MKKNHDFSWFYVVMKMTIFHEKSSFVTIYKNHMIFIPPKMGGLKSSFLAPPIFPDFRGARFCALKMQNEGRNGREKRPKKWAKKRPKTWPRATNTLIKMSASTFLDLFGVHILTISGGYEMIIKIMNFHEKKMSAKHR